MIFTDKIERNGIIIIDGYSNAKTVKGAIKDLAKEVSKYSILESNGLIDNMEETINTLNIKYDDCDYVVECESVSCATTYIDDETNEYKEANFYLHISFVA